MLTLKSSVGSTISHRSSRILVKIHWPKLKRKTEEVEREVEREGEGEGEGER